MSVFYQTYGAAKSYSTPNLNKKHVRRFDSEVWFPASMDSTMRCLEIGCGTGQFLSYLHHHGVRDFAGIDLDPTLADVVPDVVKDHFEAIDVWAFLKRESDQKPYDRIFMFDVFEHFVPEDGHKLLRKLNDVLSPGGSVTLKMPNASSPWGMQFQHGDLTHVAAYTPESIRHMAVSSGMECEACYPHYLGSPSRRILDRALQCVLNNVVATPPEIWEGNFYARLVKSN